MSKESKYALGGMSESEHSFFEGAELRIQGEVASRKIVGYAAVFNSPSALLAGTFYERIAPGAFAKTLASGRDVIATAFNHSEEMRSVLGSLSAGTLKLKEDERGLFMEIDPPDTGAGRDAVALVGRKDVRNASFVFGRGAKDSWSSDGGKRMRTLHEVELKEVTLTPFPAYEMAQVSLRTKQHIEIPDTEIPPDEYRRRNEYLRRKLSLVA